MNRTLQSMTFELEPVAPFRFDLTVAALSRRDDNLFDRWAEETYKRMPMVDSKAVEVSLQQIGSIDIPRLHVNATGLGLTSRIALAGNRRLENHDET